TMNMVSAVEDFVLCHELAHLVLDHGDDGSIAAEAAADRLALEMLSSVHVDRIRHFGVADQPPEHFAPLGYLTLKMWTIVRIAAEQRALPFVWDTPAQVELRHRQWNRAAEARLEQIDRVGTLNSFG